MRLFITLFYIGIIASSIFVSWSIDFFDDIEKIEWSKLLDGEKEENQKEIEEEQDKKIRYQAIEPSKYIVHFHLHEWSNFHTFSFQFREIITPPPELV